MIELLVLNALLQKDLTMYGVSKHIEDNFASFTKPSFGAIKPALRRLEEKGFITSRKSMSDGGKLSVFYSATKTGKEELLRLLAESLSTNPLQFFSDARIKLCCAGLLSYEDKKKLFFQIKLLALQHKVNTENILNDEFVRPDFYHRIVLDNALCEYSNLITIIEGFENDNKQAADGQRR